jgi:hypothetical protein
LEHEAKAAEEAKDLEWREKTAEKEAKAAQKELGKRRDNTSKGSSGGTKAKTTVGGSHENVRARKSIGTMLRVEKSWNIDRGPQNRVEVRSRF